MKKALPKIVFLLACILMVMLSGCRTPKEVLKTEVKQSDTLIIKSEIVKAPSLSDVLTIRDICDTITNKVREIERVFVMDGDSIKLLTDENNVLTLEINRRERTVDSLYSEIRRLKSEKEAYEKEVVVKTDWRLVLILTGIVLAFILFPIVPRFINKIFRGLLTGTP